MKELKKLKKDIVKLSNKRRELAEQIEAKIEALQSFCDHSEVWEFPYGESTWCSNYKSPIRICCFCKLKQDGHTTVPLFYQNKKRMTPYKGKIHKMESRNDTHKYSRIE